MPLETVKLIIGLFLAIKGADVLISSSIGLGRKFKVSDFFIGLVKCIYINHSFDSSNKS